MDSQATERDRRDATEDEVKTLPHVVDSIPIVVWIALVAGALERFTYYAVTAPWQNYMQNDRDGIEVPGVLGLGQATATNISNAFSFFSFIAPLPFAVLSDARIGKHKTLCISFMLVMRTFLMGVEDNYHQPEYTFGLAFAMVLLGLGTGGIKATVSPFIGDQYTVSTPQFTNIGSLSLIASTYLEKEVGFWAAYLLPLCFVWIPIPLLLFWQRSFVSLAPVGNVLPQAGRVLVYSARERFRLDAAKPVFQAEKYGRTVPWDNLFVLEMKRGLKACKVMACFVPFYLCMNQITNNFVSQAGQMKLSVIPNDTIQALNPIACVLLGPIIQQLLYPGLQRYGVAFGSISRMTWSFITISSSMAYAAGLQKLIYTRGPCYESPRTCPGSDGGKIPNNISVWVQTPSYFLLAFAEILGFTTLSEYSYSEAPQDMRSLVQALRQVTAAIGSALGMALSPVAVDPKVMYLYTGLATTMIAAAPVFWVAFRNYDKIDDEDELNAARLVEPDSHGEMEETSTRAHL
ncbi:hypothetical protein PENSOL_c009G01338 [Penicillium solitum]|uniref:Major facilitator superfamily (MFS) profile domain-containing protein n=1 Tax=Penicillium solitum TaxID=60172 RepID=A0A1V6RA64_9EURO|nr:uncharacterized protein PENSOL_c009G01338 [Penicillium solitum]OQD98299.1 hypothetical protein PENSOL_c009G01338 [Penicillium solitum]